MLVTSLLFFFPSAEFEDDPDLYVLKPIKYVGFEVWQVRTKLLFYFVEFSFMPCFHIFLFEIYTAISAKLFNGLEFEKWSEYCKTIRPPGMSFGEFQTLYSIPLRSLMWLANIW